MQETHEVHMKQKTEVYEAKVSDDGIERGGKKFHGLNPKEESPCLTDYSENGVHLTVTGNPQRCHQDLI